MGRVAVIIIGPKAKKTLQVYAEVDKGLVADHYYAAEGTFNVAIFDQRVRQISIIAREVIVQCNLRLGKDLEWELFRHIAEDLGGKDFVSLNLYHTTRPSLKPCEMVGQKVIDSIEYLSL